MVATDTAGSVPTLGPGAEAGLLARALCPSCGSRAKRLLLLPTSSIAHMFYSVKLQAGGDDHRFDALGM